MSLSATSTSLLNISRNEDTAWAACSNVWQFFPQRFFFLISNLEKSQWIHQLYEVLSLIKIWITALLFLLFFSGSKLLLMSFCFHAAFRHETTEGREDEKSSLYFVSSFLDLHGTQPCDVDEKFESSPIV